MRAEAGLVYGGKHSTFNVQHRISIGWLRANRLGVECSMLNVECSPSDENSSFAPRFRPNSSLDMKLLVFAHTPPPHHGQSYMVQLMLAGFGGDARRKKGAAASPYGVECYHVNA